MADDAQHRHPHLEINGDDVRLGVGSGIVADSTSQSEWSECRAKAAFASSLAPAAHLIETMRVVDRVSPLLDLHAQRLARSAATLGLPDPGAALADAVAKTPAGAWRVRVELSPTGIEVSRTPLVEAPAPVTIIIDPTVWQGGPLAHHKTTDRAHLDAAIALAEQHGAFDAIGHDARGRVLEGGRSNLFAHIDGRWLTPPASLPILPGVQRAAVLADPSHIGATAIEEREFTVDDLRRATDIVVTNAVRGVLPARLESE